MNAPTCSWNPISTEPPDIKPRWRRRVNPTQFSFSQGRDVNNDAVDSLRMNLRQARRALTIRDEETRRLRSAVTHLEGTVSQRERELRDTVLCLRGECPPRPQQEWLQEGSSTFRLRLQVHRLQRAVAAKQDHIDHLNRQASLGFLREAREQADVYCVEAGRLARALAAATSGIGYPLRRSSAVGDDNFARPTTTNSGASAHDNGKEEECGPIGECHATAVKFSGYHPSTQIAAPRVVHPPSYFAPAMAGTAGALPVALFSNCIANDSRETCAESCASPDRGKGFLSVQRGTGGGYHAQGETLTRVLNADIASQTADAYRQHGKIRQRQLAWEQWPAARRPFSADALIGTGTTPTSIAVGDDDIRILRGGARSSAIVVSPQRSTGRASTHSRQQGPSRGGFYSRVLSGLYVEDRRTNRMAASARLRSSARQSAAERSEAWALDKESNRLQTERARRARRMRLAAENIDRYRAERLLQLDACLARRSGGARPLDNHPPVLLSDGRTSVDSKAGGDRSNAGMEDELSSCKVTIDRLHHQSKPRSEIEAAIAAAVDVTPVTNVGTHRLENKELPMDEFQQSSEWETQQSNGQSQLHDPDVGTNFSSDPPGNGCTGKDTHNPPRRPLGKPPLPPSRANRSNKPNRSRYHGADKGNGIAGIDAVAGSSGESDSIVVGYAPWNAEDYGNDPDNAQAEAANIDTEETTDELWLDEVGEEQFSEQGWGGGGAGPLKGCPTNPRTKHSATGGFDNYVGGGDVSHRDLIPPRLDNEESTNGSVTRRMRQSEWNMGVSNHGVRGENGVIRNAGMRVRHSLPSRKTRDEMYSLTATGRGVYSGGMAVLSPVAPGSRPTPRGQEYDGNVGNLRYNDQDKHATTSRETAEATNSARRQRGQYESGVRHINGPISTHYKTEDWGEATSQRDSFEWPDSRSDVLEEEHSICDWGEVRDDNQSVPEANWLGDSGGWDVNNEGNIAEVSNAGSRDYSASNGGAGKGGDGEEQGRGSGDVRWRGTTYNLAPSLDKRSSDVDSYNSCGRISGKQDEISDREDATRYRVHALSIRDPEESCDDNGVRLPHEATTQAEVEQSGSPMGLESSERWKRGEDIVVIVPGYSPRAAVVNEDVSLVVSPPSDEETAAFAAGSMTARKIKAALSNETSESKWSHEPLATDGSDEWPINEPPSKASTTSECGDGSSGKHALKSRSKGREFKSAQSMSPRASRPAASATGVDVDMDTLVAKPQTDQVMEQEQALSTLSAGVVDSGVTTVITVAEDLRPPQVLHLTEDIARQEDCSTSSVYRDKEELLARGDSIERVPEVRGAGVASQSDGRADVSEGGRPVASVAPKLTRSDNETNRRQQSGQDGNSGVEPETEHETTDPTSLPLIASDLSPSTVAQTTSNLHVRFMETAHDAGASTEAHAALGGDAIIDDGRDNSIACSYAEESSNDIAGRYGDSNGGISGAAMESTTSFPTMSPDTSDRSESMIAPLAFGTAGQGMESTSTFAISSDTGISVGGVRSTASLGTKPALDREDSSAVAGELSQPLPRSGTNLGDHAGKFLESGSSFPSMSSDIGRGSPEHIPAALSLVEEESPPGSDALIVEGGGCAIDFASSSARAISHEGAGFPVDDRLSLALADEMLAPDVGHVSIVDTTTIGNVVQGAMAEENGDTVEHSLGDDALGRESLSSNGSVLDVGSGGVDIFDDDDGYF